MKLFTAVSYDFSYTFVPGKPFQPRLMFVGKVRSLPKVGHLMHVNLIFVYFWDDFTVKNLLLLNKKSLIRILTRSSVRQEPIP
jgi:hypothetical protein